MFSDEKNCIFAKILIKMETLNIEKIRDLYPDEWVLLGNPVMDTNDVDVLNGIPLYHSRDKKEVCYLGKATTKGYAMITLIYTGIPKPMRRTGVFKRISQ
jgi:hypothetical protein